MMSSVDSAYKSGALKTTESGQGGLTMAASSISDWNHIIGDAFGTILAEAHDSKTFSAALRTFQIGDTPFFECSSSPASVVHEPGPADRKDPHSYIIKTQISGWTTLSCGGQSLELAPGDYVICDNTRRYALNFDTDTTIISIPISEAYLKRFTPFPRNICFVTASRENPIRKVAYDYLNSLIRNSVDNLNDFSRSKLAATFFEIAILSITDSPNELNVSKRPRYELFDRCCRHVEDNFQYDDFCLKSLAEQMGISIRHLQTTFSAHGVTVTDYIASCRLNEAKRLLESGVYKDRSVGEIAYSVGYKSHAHFSRAFKSKFGCSPNSLRGH